ncbi:MAG: transposase [Desulfobacterales bacterium]
MSQEPSGRAFLQKLFDSGGKLVKCSHFFETLKSKRRLKLCREVSLALYAKTKAGNRQADPFEAFKSLDECDIYAGDGHYHAAAVHDVRKAGKRYPTQHFYSVDLRSHALRQLTLADTSGNRKREYDTRAIKRLDIETLRQSAPKGRKVIYVWDKAGIDFFHWFKLKHAGGIYFISREKENMDLMVMAELGYDKKDPINVGVRSYELVGCAAGVTMQRIAFKCPLSGRTYRFVTSLSRLPPGLIAYLYKTRWDLEKIFDQVKNKLCEKKAWATSFTAKNMQAQFICMAHNLMLFLEQCLAKKGCTNDTEDIRRRKRLDKCLAQKSTRKAQLPIFLKRPKRATQRPLKFIRWLRHHLYTNTSWVEAATALRLIYDVF